MTTASGSCACPPSAAARRESRCGSPTDALEADATLREALGTALIDTFLSIKRYELERYHRHVSEWDIAEYAHHL
jgi:glutamine synthetase